MRVLLGWLLAGFLINVSFTRGQDVRWRAGHSYPRPLPQELMVDAVNYIGLVLLHAHNQHNENNIALSPYGATSVLVALGEGVQGAALDEILRATLLPQDVTVTRVGLRDIHRHLKSYFIPQEGFLAGLTFSHENVTLKPSYESILRFYGYDVDSFNNALYPDPYSSTTTPGDESTTESLSLSSSSSAANLSSSSTLTSPSPLENPSTVENRDELIAAESTTVETTGVPTLPSTLTQTTGVETTLVGTSPVATSTPSTSVDTSTPAGTSSPATQTTITARPESTVVVTSQPTPTTIASTAVPSTVTTVLPISTTAEVTTTLPTSTTTTTTIGSSSPTTVIASSTPTTTPPTTTTTTETTTTTTTTNAPSTSQTTVMATTRAQATTPTVQSTTTSTTTATSPTTTTTSTGTTATQLQSNTISFTLNAVPNTVATDDSTSPASSSPTGPITVSLQPTTVGSTNTPSIDTTSAPPSSDATTLTTVAETHTISFSVNSVPNTITNGGSTSPFGPTGSTPTGPITVSLQPTTVGSTGTSATSAPPTSATTTTTTVAGTQTTSSTGTPAITLSVVPSTLGTVTEGTTTTTQSPISLITPSDGNLSTGFMIDVRPSTAPGNSSTIKAESTGAGIIANNRPTKRSSLPRFRDDAQLVNSLNSNKSVAMDQPGSRGIISEGTAQDLFKTKQNLTGKTTTNPPLAESTTQKGGKTGGSPTENSFESIFTSTAAEYSDEYESSVFTVETEENSSGTTQESSSTSELETSSESTEVDEATLSGEVPAGLDVSSNRTLTNSEEAKARGTRSVIDYLIARYHDNNPHPSHGHGHGNGHKNGQTQVPNDYEPAKPTTFSVNGKIREPNISFMTYDTVLPFRYISYLNALALTFPLDSTKYYLLLVLPVDEMGIDNLVSNMMSTTLKQIIYNLQPTRVKATIPSFTLKGYVVLTPTLQKLGIRQIFEPRHADFSRMTDDKDIYVTNIEQAVTVTIRNYVDPSTVQNDEHFRRRGPVQFTADHPFLYFVMDSQIHVALMAGKIINPLNSRIR